MSDKPPPPAYSNGLPFTNEGKLSAERGPAAYFHRGFPFTANHSLAIDAGDDPEYVAPHTHVIDDVIELREALDAKAAASHTHVIDDVIELREALDAKAAASHTHVITDVTNLAPELSSRLQFSDVVDQLSSADGTRPLSAKQGGVLKAAIDNINALLQSDSGNLDTLQEIVDFITLNRADLDNLAVPSIAGLQPALDSKQATISGAASTIVSANLAASRALVSDGGGKVAASTATADELLYLVGATSNIQTQLDAKAAASHIHSMSSITGLQSALDSKQATITGAASTVTASNLTASRAVGTDANGKLAVSSVTSGELGQLIGVTSNVQTQLNAKANSSALGTAAAATLTVGQLDTSTGRVIKVGDYGYGVGRNFVVVDFNTFTVPGKYTADSGSTNSPVPTSAFVVEVSTGSASGNNNRVVQVATVTSADASIGRTFTRVGRDSTWTAWVEQYTSGNVTGAASTVMTSNLTASRAVVTDGSGKLSAHTAALGTAAAGTLTTSATDTTPDRVLKVGGFGLGGGAVDVADLTSSNVNFARIFRQTGSAVGGHGAGTGGTIALPITGTPEIGFISVTGNAAFIGYKLGATGTPVWRHLWHSGNLTLTTSQTDETSGRVLRVGDFGVGRGLDFTTYDLNTLMSPGFYGVLVGSTNVPLAGVSFVATISNGSASGSNNRTVQSLTVITNGASLSRTFSRAYTGSVWSSWVEGWTTGNLTLTTSQTDATSGRVLRVGDFGVGSTNGAIYADLNSVAANGFFRVAGTGLNNPFPGSSSGGIHSQESSTYAWQFAARHGGAPHFRARFKSNGSWGGWADILTDASVIPVSKGGTGATSAAAARTALGLGAIATMSTSDVVTIATQQTITAYKTFSNGVIFNSSISSNQMFVAQASSPSGTAFLIRPSSDQATSAAMLFYGRTAPAPDGVSNYCSIQWQGVEARLRFLSGGGGATLECGAVIETSALRFKKDVETLEADGEAFDRLRPVRYREKESETPQIGLIAEEVCETYPEFVHHDADGQCSGIQYSKMVAVLIAEVKALRARVASLESAVLPQAGPN